MFRDCTRCFKAERLLYRRRTLLLIFFHHINDYPFIIQLALSYLNDGMFRNYFITAFRNLRRNKLFLLINILGLSIGIIASLLIFLIVYFELSYDKESEQIEFKHQKNIILPKPSYFHLFPHKWIKGSA